MILQTKHKSKEENFYSSTYSKDKTQNVIFSEHPPIDGIFFQFSQERHKNENLLVLLEELKLLFTLCMTIIRKTHSYNMLELILKLDFDLIFPLPCGCAWLNFRLHIWLSVIISLACDVFNLVDIFVWEN